MPTKPDPVNDLPPLWGGAGNYPAGVYPPTLPWGDAHPLAGQPLPWGDQPRLNSTNLANFADTGLTPQVPTVASQFNEWLRRVAIWQTNWVALGTNAPDADAHIMETTAAGLSRAVAYEATVGYQNSGPAAAVLIMGFSVPAGETSSFGDNTTTNLGANAAISGPATASVTAGTFDAIGEAGTVKPGVLAFYTQTGALPTTVGEMAWGGRNILTVGGSGGLPRRIAIPVEEYLAGPVNTVNAIEDTGLEIAVLLANGDVVYAELDMEVENTGAGNDINVRIEVDGTPIGGTRQYRPTAAARVQVARRVVKYTATATQVYTFKGRHGAGAGTTTSTNLRLTIRQANATS